jgi:hypothetical protein
MNRKSISTFFAILILIVIAYSIYPCLIGGSKMEDFCNTIQPGEFDKNIVTRAKKAGYSYYQSPEESPLLIVDSQAMGRFICEISISEGKATKSRYVFND